MRAIAMLLVVTRAHFSAKVHASPAKPLQLPSWRTTSHIHTAPAKTRPIKDQTMKFVRSPLAASAALTAAEVDALDSVFSDSQVQLTAGRLHLKQAHLLEVAGFRSAIAQAIAAVDEPAAITPEKVVAILDRMAADIDDEVAAVREDRAQHDACHKARLERLMPLRHVVSTRLGALTRQREHCLVRIDAARRASTMSGSASHRYNGLVAAGLKPDEITAALGIQSPADDEAAVRARIVAIDAEIVPLHAFGESGDVEHLAGLGLDDLIAQAYPYRVGAEVTA